MPRQAELSRAVNQAGALKAAKEIGAKGVRRTVCWQTARTLFRILFAASFAVFAGRLIEEGAIDTTALAAALLGLAFLSGAGVLSEWQAAGAEADLADRLRAMFRESLSSMRRSASGQNPWARWSPACSVIRLPSRAS